MSEYKSIIFAGMWRSFSFQLRGHRNSILTKIKMTTYQIDVNEGMNKSLADLVAPWRPEPLKNYCISNTNLIDVVSGVSLPGAYIFIEQGIISKVEFGSEKPVTVDEVAFEIIDGTGKYVTPGLIDSHVHIASVGRRG